MYLVKTKAAEIICEEEPVIKSNRIDTRGPRVFADTGVIRELIGEDPKLDVVYKYDPNHKQYTKVSKEKPDKNENKDEVKIQNEDADKEKKDDKKVLRGELSPSEKAANK